MGFIIKTVFWFSLVLLIIPLDTSETSGDHHTIGAFDAFFAAREAIGDVGAMCERKPEVCEIGRSAMHTIGIRAREGARLAYSMLDEHMGDDPAAVEFAEQPEAMIEHMHTGTVDAGDIELDIAGD